MNENTIIWIFQIFMGVGIGIIIYNIIEIVYHSNDNLRKKKEIICKWIFHIIDKSRFLVKKVKNRIVSYFRPKNNGMNKLTIQNLEIVKSRIENLMKISLNDKLIIQKLESDNSDYELRNKDLEMKIVYLEEQIMELKNEIPKENKSTRKYTKKIKTEICTYCGSEKKIGVECDYCKT